MEWSCSLESSIVFLAETAHSSRSHQPAVELQLLPDHMDHFSIEKGELENHENTSAWYLPRSSVVNPKHGRLQGSIFEAWWKSYGVSPPLASRMT